MMIESRTISSSDAALVERTPAQIIADILAAEDYLDAQVKRFDAFARPHKERIEALKAQLQDYLNRVGGKNFKCNAGTAYLSTIVSPRIEGDKTAFLDWVLDDWDRRGAMLQVGAPVKAALQDYMDANGGRLPPQVTTSSITRVNVRRS